ncbi:MAG: NAD-dependent epimerase/dehydratase family protein [Myxococcota bacterium]|jgi:nucleoside-diphosphate-sugar epimerase|nr:NAD-dependent epimerase/dehydratase family protein [Myxococcota bacterium]
MVAGSKRILVTGALGQIGTVLTLELRRRYGDDRVVASDKRSQVPPELVGGPFVPLDVLDRPALEEAIRDQDIGTVYHLAALLSAVGEQHPQLCWRVNVDGLYNVLEIARQHDLRLFCPSSIAVFGPETPREQTPQETILRPTSMYGVTKVTGERLCEYYATRYGVDVRGIRYPGLISSETPPGGGTTDYAVEIFYEAVRCGRYTCFVRADTVLPMMYMPDAIRATLQLMAAPRSELRHHADFNLAALSFSAGELAAEIRKHLPGFECTFVPDYHQAIADSWPCSIDDTAARAEWGWRPEYDLATMTTDMLAKLAERQRRGTL